MTCRTQRGTPHIVSFPFGVTCEWKASKTHALDDLGLLDEERADNALADAVGAARATVRALDRLDTLRDVRVLARAKGRDLGGAIVVNPSRPARNALL